uniref:Protein disulfide isomerase-like 5-2 n=1 Tax=Ananas comosus var. bracteatus TaxID=296719 RepID=A0A6V7QFU8_ANACO|nr:unnamed protein product [Ananas comosus var. bracteatus]
MESLLIITVQEKADLLVRSLKKLAAPDVSLLESDSSIYNFVQTAGTDFPIFLGFGLAESVIAEFASKFKKKAWFAVAKDFSEEMMAVHHFDKVPALVSFHPKYNDQSVFYGPFEGKFLEEFIQQNQLPLAVPINSETIKSLTDDERKIVLAIVEDELDEKSMKLAKTLRSTAAANRDLVFGYVGIKQWEEFVDTFDSSKSSKLPKMLVWDRNEEYHLVVGSESLDEEDQASQISRFLEGYREGKTIKKRVSGPSLLGFFKSLISIRTVYLVVFVAALLMLMQHLSNRRANDHPQVRQSEVEPELTERSTSESESRREDYQPGDKED